MTVEEFLDWPGDGTARTHQLVDGEPQAMAPASITHGIIQANIAGVHGNHLRGSSCYVVVAPGIIPRVRSEANMRVPDLAVSCEADVQGIHALTEPIVLVEILSPSNEPETRAQCVDLHDDLLSVREILLIRSTHIAAELIRREPDGSWPANSAPIAEEAPLVLESLDFLRPLNAALYEGTRFASPAGRADQRRGSIRRGRARRTGARENAAPPDWRRVRLLARMR